MKRLRVFQRLSAMAKARTDGTGLATVWVSGAVCRECAPYLATVPGSVSADNGATAVLYRLDKALIVLDGPVQAGRPSNAPLALAGVPAAIVVAPRDLLLFQGYAARAAECGMLRKAFDNPEDAEAWLAWHATALRQGVALRARLAGR